MSERETQILNHTDLKYLLIDSFNLYTEDSSYISGNNPYSFSINKKTAYILIKNVHESGSGRGNEDEARIQIARTSNFLEALNSGKPNLILGYFADYNVFTAWNPFLFYDRINARQTVSKYTRFSIQEEAQKEGISCYKDNNGEVVITFRPEYIGLYLDNYKSMHLSDKDALQELIKRSENIEETENETGEEFELDDNTFIITHKKFKRDPLFKKIINEIYDHRCALCGIQLELTEAAHIIPHSHESGTDDPTNGICMCPLHHTAYDKGLIYIDEQYNIKINEAKIEYLQKIRKDGGIRKFEKLQDEKLCLPSSYSPSIDFLRLANQIRGIVA